MRTTRKICVVITARPSYSRIKTALRAIQQHHDLDLQIVLAGPALLNRFGNIDDVLHNDGFTVTERVYAVLDGDNVSSMGKTTGIGLIELSSVFQQLKPDMVVVIADRFETISVSIAAAYQNIPLVHVQGGEITGSIDEKVRHANTKFADIHLVSTSFAKSIVERLGEDAEYVFNTGCPSIDLAADILEKPSLNFNPYIKYGGLGTCPNYTNGYVVVMQHPVTTEYQESKYQVEETLQAIKDLKLTAFWFSPNADAGTDALSNSIRQFREDYDMSHVQFFENMVPEDFLRLVYNSICLVGNSSMGIRECSFLGVPVVNIGSRQAGRQRAPNVLDVEHDKSSIIEAIHYCRKALRPTPSYIYGAGDSGKKIADILATVPLRYSKTLNFTNEKLMPNTGTIGVKRATRKKYKTT